MKNNNNSKKSKNTLGESGATTPGMVADSRIPETNSQQADDTHVKQGQKWVQENKK